MNINELRIGNWVENIRTEGRAQVLGIVAITEDILIKAFSRYEDIETITVPLSAYRGIPLVASMLPKCGLQEYKHGFYGYQPTGKPFDIIIDNELNVVIGCNSFKLETVHQLQNMVYALCTEELDIEL